MDPPMSKDRLAHIYDKAINEFYIAQHPEERLDDKSDAHAHLALGLQLFCSAIENSLNKPDQLYGMAISHFQTAQTTDNDLVRFMSIATGLQQLSAALKKNFAQ
jgi:hypothetical protein